MLRCWCRMPCETSIGATATTWQGVAAASTGWTDCGRAATPFAAGSPIDLICRERDSLELPMRRRLDEGDACFSALSKQWAEGTRQAFGGLPKLDLEGH